MVLLVDCYQKDCSLKRVSNIKKDFDLDLPSHKGLTYIYYIIPQLILQTALTLGNSHVSKYFVVKNLNINKYKISSIQS